MASSCGNRNEPSGFTKYGEYFDWHKKKKAMLKSKNGIGHTHNLL
jgi:hypothetical protein